MYITREDLNKKLYEEIIDAIVRDDPEREEYGIRVAIETVRTYVSSRYDVDQEFKKTGKARNFMLVNICAKIAMYEIADVLEQMPVTIQNPYDNTMELLKDIQAGKATLPGVSEPTDPETGEPDTYIKYGQSDYNRY
jgi:Protein of unknown function (DUF1320).